jgi:2-polyprenyl-3-methyl-5-hydroxy-6-metoxy-1,4-benzoquinol methylase
MARLSENILFWLAKRFYRTEVAHSNEMKVAQSSPEGNASYRASSSSKVVAAAQRYGIPLAEKVVLDLGCNKGALTVQYLKQGAKRVIGVDIDAEAIEVARAEHTSPQVEFRVCSVNALPLPDESVDTILCYDVLEHVSQPAEILRECKRVLRVDGQMLIGTWGWYHPFAPHLWATMPVPWAHVFVSEATLLRTCRRVFHQPWYVPNMHDLDEHGQKLADKYCEETISTDYLNKYLISDFERVFKQSGLQSHVHLVPFGSRYARWSAIFLRIPFVREFLTGYLWAVLYKAAEHSCEPQAPMTPVLKS